MQNWHAAGCTRIFVGEESMKSIKVGECRPGDDQFHSLRGFGPGSSFGVPQLQARLSLHPNAPPCGYARIPRADVRPLQKFRGPWPLALARICANPRRRNGSLPASSATSTGTLIPSAAARASQRSAVSASTSMLRTLRSCRDASLLRTLARGRFLTKDVDGRTFVRRRASPKLKCTRRLRPAGETLTERRRWRALCRP